MNHQPSCVFYNKAGYIEIIFNDIIGASELCRLLSEVNILAEIHGPIAVLVDGRNGRLNHDAGTLMAFAEMNMSPKLTSLIVLTHTSSHRRDAIVKNPKGLVPQVSAKVFGVPHLYLSDEAEARRQAATTSDPYWVTPNRLGEQATKD